MNLEARVRSWLVVSWWVVFPGFALLTLRLFFERSCGDATNLLPELSGHPTTGLMVAAIYVAVHAWAAIAYLLTASEAGALVPGWSAWKAVWGSQLIKVILLGAAGVAEYAPASVLRAFGAAIGCGG